MKGIDGIEGAEQLVSVFGAWPSFHDAEVLWMKFDRQSAGNGRWGPTLDSLVHIFEITSEIDAEGSFELRNHVLVHFRFTEVAEVQVEGFNHQNALMGLTLTDLSDRQMERVRWAVRFHSAFGVDASLKCYEIKVVSVVPCDKTGTPVADH